MPVAKLKAALESVDWKGNLQAFLEQDPSVAAIANGAVRVAIWCKQIEDIEGTNPAIPFVREMQIALQHVAVLASLSLYKPAASALRALVESALYYTYFRTHEQELATVARDPEFYVSKAEIIEFHKRHTPRFENCQQAFSWVARLNSWYSSVSAVIHSQIPGNWLTHTSIEGIKPNIATLEVLTAAFVEAERLVHELFLCTVGGDIWGDITAPAKKRLLHALPGNVKQVLKFDGA